MRVPASGLKSEARLRERRVVQAKEIEAAGEGDRSCSCSCVREGEVEGVFFFLS
jgi:hypothetical protein